MLEKNLLESAVKVAWSLLEPVQALQKLAYSGGSVMKSFRLTQVYFFLQFFVKKRCLDITAHQLRVLLSALSKNSSYCFEAYYWTESLQVVDAWALGEALYDVAFPKPYRIAFLVSLPFEYPPVMILRSPGGSVRIHP